MRYLRIDREARCPYYGLHRSVKGPSSPNCAASKLLRSFCRGLPFSLSVGRIFIGFAARGGKEVCVARVGLEGEKEGTNTYEVRRIGGGALPLFFSAQPQSICVCPPSLPPLSPFSPSFLFKWAQGPCSSVPRPSSASASLSSPLSPPPQISRTNDHLCA